MKMGDTSRGARLLTLEISDVVDEDMADTGPVVVDDDERLDVNG